MNTSEILSVREASPHNPAALIQGSTTIVECAYKGVFPEDTEVVQRLASCWNACHGLTLPPDVPPGILADAARRLVECPDLPDDWTACNEDAFHTFTDAFRAWQGEVREILAKLQPPA